MAKGLKISFDNVSQYFYIKNDRGERISSHPSFKSAVEHIKKMKQKNSELKFPSYCLGNSSNKSSSTENNKSKINKDFFKEKKENKKLTDLYNELIED